MSIYVQKIMLSNAWEELALEAFQAASEKISVREFKKQCELTPPGPGKTFYDRERVAEDLIESGVIEIDDGILRVSKAATKNLPDWLIEGLEIGRATSWQALDYLDPSEEVLRKIDQQLLQKIGLEGELAVMKLLLDGLPPAAHNRLRHVSLTDDSAGFDIFSPSFNNSDNTVLLEVKTTSRQGKNFTFFISKNESRIASHNQNWHLIGMLRAPDGFKLIGFLNYDQFSQFLPVDVSSSGAWESAKITIPSHVFLHGLP